MILQLIGKKNPILHTICDEIPQGENVDDLVRDMFETMRAKKGIGLAAPQIGEPVRIIVVEYGSLCTELINPVIIKTPGKIVTSIKEGCLSFPGRFVDVKRHKRVIVKGYDKNWKEMKLDVRGLSAFLIQHEICHLDGITII